MNLLIWLIAGCGFVSGCLFMLVMFIYLTVRADVVVLARKDLLIMLGENHGNNGKSKNEEKKKKFTAR